jgi:hypothetical protein
VLPANTLIADVRSDERHPPVILSHLRRTFCGTIATELEGSYPCVGYAREASSAVDVGRRVEA